MRKRTIIILSIAVVSILAFSFWFFSNGKGNDVTFRIEKVQRGDVQVVVTATGTLSAVTTVQVGTQVSGTISKLYVDFNDRVKKGQIIALIDPTFLQASVRDAEANLQRAKAQENEAKRNFQRVKKLLEKNLASQADYDAALTQYESAAAAKKQADAQLERARINLRYATIKAPIDGVVLSRAVDVGQTVAASLAAPTIFTIANDLTKTQVQANVDEADIGRVQVGQDVSFTVDSYPEQVFHGTVRQIRLAPVTIQNVVNYTVIIDVPNPDLKLMPGMTATVTILVTKKEGVLKVPTIALRFQPSADQIEMRKEANPDSSSADTARAGRRRQWMQRIQAGGGEMQRLRQPMGEHGFSRLWILNEKKKLSPLFVHTGISDGTFTEIVDGRITEGQEIVVGVLTQKPSSVSPIPPPGGGRMRF